MRNVLAMSLMPFAVTFNTGLFESQTHSPIKTLDSINSDNVVNLPLVVRELIQEKYSKCKVVGQCAGSFANEGESEYAIALFDATDSLVFYIAVLRQDDSVKSTLELFRKNSNPRTALTEEVQCLSTMEVRRRNRAFSKMEGVEGDITSKTHYFVRSSDSP